jgi:hypothetical protein
VGAVSTTKTVLPIALLSMPFDPVAPRTASPRSRAKIVYRQFEQ